MNKNDPITITPCANGFIVTPGVSYNQAYLISDKLVFDDHGDLMEFLRYHFDVPLEWNELPANQAEGK